MAKLVSNLTKFARNVDDGGTRALLRTGADIVDLVKQITPVDTGALRQSYGVLPETSQKVLIGSDMPYAPHVEYGTVNSAAQPHLTPAFMQSEETFKARIAEEMQKLAQ